MKRSSSPLFHSVTALAAASSIALGFTSAPAFAQQYPTKPIALVAITPAGGTTDLTARAYARQMEKRLGQTMIVENRAGAGGTIAGNYVKNAAPDGYTLLIGGLGMSSTFVANNSVDLPVDLAPVSAVNKGSFFVFMRASLPVRTMQELIAYSKANPGKLNYATSNPLTLLAVEALKLKTGITYTAIPYKGAAPIVTDMLGGTVDFTIESLPTFQSFLPGGKVRVPMVAAAKRSTLLPDVASAGEIGIANYESGFYLGIWAPQRTPADVIRRLSNESVVVLKVPELVDYLKSVGTEPLGTTPEELVAIHKAYNSVLNDAAKASGFKPQ
ncbi:MAG: tripartite tricarboxylate transporter substrate binding protein [Gammaproteobacteria bacterium]|nr:tripartite tricarboxylate transporter substrate binding protein [Gammaproteobacteria bacterium]